MTKIKKPKIKINYVEYGLANCFTKGKEKWIELNENLKKYPELKKKIMEHELKHYYSKGRFDFMIEIKEMFNRKKQKEISTFMWRHPKAYAQLIPLTIDKRGVFPDYFALFYYFIVISVLVILFKVLI